MRKSGACLWKTDIEHTNVSQWGWYFSLVLVLLTLLGRLFYLMIGKADYYGVQAKELHERERKIKAERGEIKDCHGNVLAANRSVSTISVIHSQMKEPERVITLCRRN